MNAVDKTLQNILDNEIRMTRKLRGIVGTTIIAGIAIILIQFFSQEWVWGGSLVAVLTFLIINRKWNPDLVGVCRSLEDKNPAIRDLVTSIHELDESEDGMTEVIRQRLIDQFRSARKSTDWAPLVSGEQLAVSRVVSLAFIAALLFPAWGNIVWNSGSQDVVKAFEKYNVVITPENEEIEKGSTVPVMARFQSDAIPSRVWMVYSDKWGNTNQVELVKNLDDPVFGTAITNVEKDTEYKVYYEDRSKGPFNLTVFEFPTLVRADASITYPEFLGKEKELIEDTLRITANEGSQLDYQLYFNVPVAEARLVEVVARSGNNASEAPIVPMEIPLLLGEDKPDTASWSVKLEDDMRFRLHLTDAKGRENKLKSTIRIKVIKNKAPEFKFTRPGKDIEVTPIEELALAGEVKDDFGILRHGLTMDGLGEASDEIVLDSNSSDVVTNKVDKVYLSGNLDHVIKFEDQDSKVGDLVSVAAWAEDYNQEGQVRRSYSDIYFVTVKSFEQILRQGQQQNQQQQQQNEQQQGQQGQQGGPGGDLIENQKMIISATWNTFKKGTHRQYRDSVETLVESQGQLIPALDMAVQEMNPSPAVQKLVDEAKQLMEKSSDQLSLALESEDPSDLRSAVPVQTSILQKLNRIFEQDEANVSQTQNQQSQSGNQSNRSQRMLDQLEFNENENNYQTQNQAQAEQTEEQQERSEVLNKLRDLAQRQMDINERIQELDAALREAETEEEKEKIRRELQKLQEEQRELMQDLDEARQDVAESSARENQETLEQMDQTREAMENAQRAMENNQLTQARNEGARAEEQIDELRQDFRERSSSQFTEQIRDLASRTRELQETQEEISERIKNAMEEESSQLTGGEEERELTDQLRQNRENLDQILESMRQISELSEDVEPLLSESLYDTLRQANQDQIEEVFDSVQDMVERGFIPMADQFKEQSEEAVTNLAEGVEDAVEKVLGDETAALELAANQLRNLREDVENEIRERAGSDGEPGEGESPSEPGQGGQDPENGQNPEGSRPGQGDNESESESPNSDPNAQGQGGSQPSDQENQETGEQQRPGQGQQPGQGNGTSQEDQNQENPQGSGQNPQSPNPQGGGQGNPQDQQNQPGGGGGGNPQVASDDDENTPFFMDQNPNQEGGNSGGSSTSGPLTGSRFQQWSRGLEEVEDMVFDESLRDQAAQINDRAREIRQEFTRNGKEPQWDLVNMEILDPILQLEQRVQEQIAIKRQKNSDLVPVDRDPVPSEFSKYVEDYYRRLSEMRQAPQGN